MRHNDFLTGKPVMTPVAEAQVGGDSDSLLQGGHVTAKSDWVIIFLSCLYYSFWRYYRMVKSQCHIVAE